MRRHGFRCDCPYCLEQQLQFDLFLAFIGAGAFALVALAGFVQLYRSGLLSW